VGLADTAVRVAAPAGACTSRLVVFATPARVAVIKALVSEATAVVVMLKFAVEVLAATTTDPGTLAAEGTLLERETSIPPAGAGPVSVTVPVTPVPPSAGLGAAETALRAGGATPISADLETPL
jgi:hypothetical protein